MKCPRCGTQIEIDRQNIGQIITCPGCSARLQRKKPSNQTQQLKQLLYEIAQAFPDGVVDISRWDHSRWDDRISHLCSQLGYTNVGAFLQTYGFQVQFEGQHRKKQHRKKNGAVAAAVALVLLVTVAFVSVKLLTGRINQGASQMQASANASAGSLGLERTDRTPDTVPNDQKYKLVFDAYTEACSMGVNAYQETVWSYSGTEPYFPNCVDAIGYGYYESGYPLCYTYYDVNNDGTDELFLGQDNGQRIVLVDGYTYDGAKPVKLFPDLNFGSRTDLIVTANHELVVNGSSGADNPSAAYYLLSADSYLPVFSHGYCTFNFASDYPNYTPVDISNWTEYVDTTGIHLEFSWVPL